MRLRAHMPVRDGKVLCPRLAQLRRFEDCRACPYLKAIENEGPSSVVRCVPNVTSFAATLEDVIRV
jgi:hypothetical protein